MKQFIEKHIARLWNRRAGERAVPVNRGALDIGGRVVDGEPVGTRVGIAQNRRAEHLVLLGKTGTGKSYLIRHLAEQDILAGRGFIFFDLHGDVTSFLLKTIALRERTLKKDLSDRLIVIDPADPEYSPGMNLLEVQGTNDRFIQIAEFSQILKERWHLDTFGARTDELLRNALFVLSESGLTLVELAPLLTDAVFRSRCLGRVTNDEVREYFEHRYDQLSDAMKRVMAEPVLNKVSLFLSDVKFRHIVGQQHSTFSLVRSMNRNCWIILNLDKGRLGEHGATLGSVFLTKTMHEFFLRAKHDVFSVYADEVQNLVSHSGGLETMLAEARKKGGGVVTANQFLSQYPTETQHAILSAGSFGFFQLSGVDAQQIAAMLDGGKSLVERLKNLPRRHLILKTVHERSVEAVVPVVREPNVDATDLYRRSRARWARPRREIEEEIRSRREVGRRNNREVLDAWE
jgi:Helicase HerA, central domain